MTESVGDFLVLVDERRGIDLDLDLDLDLDCDFELGLEVDRDLVNLVFKRFSFNLSISLLFRLMFSSRAFSYADSSIFCNNSTFYSTFVYTSGFLCYVCTQSEIQKTCEN